MTESKVLPNIESIGVTLREKHPGSTIGFTNGVFDLLHPGHVEYLETAKSYCDILVVGVNSSESVKKLKGDSRPVNDSDSRMRVIASLEAVDYVAFMPYLTCVEMLLNINPDIWFKGGDYTLNTLNPEEVKTANTIGTEIKIIPKARDVSTTDIINRLKL